MITLFISYSSSKNLVDLDNLARDWLKLSNINLITGFTVIPLNKTTFEARSECKILKTFEGETRLLTSVNNLSWCRCSEKHQTVA